MSEILEKGMLIAFGLITVSFFTPFMFPLFRIIEPKENSFEYITAAKEDIRQFNKDLTDFQASNYQENISNLFHFPGNILVFSGREGNENTIDFFFFLNVSALFPYKYHIQMNQSYTIIIENSNITNYSFVYQNFSRFLFFF